jgi:Calcineurin-like phosphoesterase
MIPREVFERARVLRQAEQVRDAVDRELQKNRQELSLGEQRVSRPELVEVRNRLDASLKRERQEKVSAEAAIAYLPRDATLSNLQSLAASRLTLEVSPMAAPDPERAISSLQVADAEVPEGAPAEPLAAREIGTEAAPPHPVTALSVADRIDDALNPLPSSRRGAQEELEPRVMPYGPDDPIWLGVGLAVAFRKVRDHELGALPLNAEPATAPLGQQARLFILGDWGTGTERAGRVATAIHKQLVDPEFQGRDCHVIHLGDTYVAGWPKEQAQHVIRLWPVRGGARATSWALPGNHDYYSGGDGFFDVLLRNPLFAHQQAGGRPTSLFELSNHHWCVLGLDTGWYDHNLPPEEVAWLEAALDRAGQQGQKVILLSHHQPWSAFGEGPHPPLWKRVVAVWLRLKGWLTRRPRDTTLWGKVKPLIASRPLEAWFWGHEHRLALYKPYMHEIARPRLVGNGGVPSPVTDASYYTHGELLELDYEEPLPPPEDAKWCRFAFAVVDLDGDQFSEAYFDEFGTPIPT